MKKKFTYFKFRADDHTFYIYTLKVLGKILGIAFTALDFVASIFNKKNTKHFNKKRNLFILQRKKEIQKYHKPYDDEFNKKFLKGDTYDFNGIYLPNINNARLMRMVYDDSLKVYTELNDDYSYKVVDRLEEILQQGTYCYVGPSSEDITIKKGYTVIDAGAWIGDFSAYASKKGAYAYAFEPSPSNIKLLQKTVEYNKDNGGEITIVPYGLGEKEDELDFFENEEGDNTAANSFRVEESDGTVKLKITTIDNWVEKKNIKKVDFIKSDIEGHERYMLLGATRTLKRDAPILSICTYHLPDDREVIKEIILKANPNYKIIQRRMILFAYVP